MKNESTLSFAEVEAHVTPWLDIPDPEFRRFAVTVFQQCVRFLGMSATVLTMALDGLTAEFAVSARKVTP